MAETFDSGDNKGPVGKPSGGIDFNRVHEESPPPKRTETPAPAADTPTPPAADTPAPPQVGDGTIKAGADIKAPNDSTPLTDEQEAAAEEDTTKAASGILSSYRGRVTDQKGTDAVNEAASAWPKQMADAAAFAAATWPDRVKVTPATTRAISAMERGLT